ncbi:uncharacterized protein PADG_11984 [Paracoccidioides brasiliensis Pb18]|uniref:Uncharacterized protein n=1 Tax=Paracoccidioides brasiliensis (strain Pb18) TaxID=502780 RepID=A0A0A0HT67_PARBD|nr:uncharacterized protein PADG_11984 [Paracoccidioides brasiliensis Pb18]KGM91847.1 hypothetical protein PADG_11984 [Paracoccidioides brasiliensis Pb18]
MARWRAESFANVFEVVFDQGNDRMSSALTVFVLAKAAVYVTSRVAGQRNDSMRSAPCIFLTNMHAALLEVPSLLWVVCLIASIDNNSSNPWSSGRAQRAARSDSCRLTIHPGIDFVYRGWLSWAYITSKGSSPCP